jgi:hypothetical protein
VSAAVTDREERLGEEFARALFAKDFEGVSALIDPGIDFRALTPRRSWEADGPDALLADVLKVWFDDSRELLELQSVQSGQVGDRRRVASRFGGRSPDGPFVIEQQAYYATEDGRINWMRIVCSGFRPPGDQRTSPPSAQAAACVAQSR